MADEIKEKTNEKRALIYIDHKIADYIGDLLLIADGEFNDTEDKCQQAADTIAILEYWRFRIITISKGGKSGFDD